MDHIRLEENCLLYVYRSRGKSEFVIFFNYPQMKKSTKIEKKYIYSYNLRCFVGKVNKKYSEKVILFSKYKYK